MNNSELETKIPKEQVKRFKKMRDKLDKIEEDELRENIKALQESDFDLGMTIGSYDTK